MKKIFIRSFDCLKRVDSKNLENATIIALIDEFATEALALKGIITNVEAAESIATDPTLVTGLDIKTAKGNLSSLISNCLYRVGVKADQIVKKDLSVALNRPATYFSGSGKDALLTRADKTIKLIDLNKDILTNLKPTDLPKMKAAYAVLFAIKDQPRKNVIDKKALVTDPIKQYIKDGKASMKRTIKLVRGNDDVFSKEIREEYELSAKMVKPITVPTPVNINLVDAVTGKGLQNVSALRSSSKAKKKPIFVSDVDGLIAFKTHASGKVVYLFTLAGYQDLSVVFDVKNKVLNVFEVKMVKS